MRSRLCHLFAIAVFFLLEPLAARALAAPNISSLSPTSGAVGATVTVNGTGFGATQGTSTIRFNGTLATPTSWSATSIVVTAPAGATTGNVVVTVAGAASNNRTFTVLATPAITSLSPTAAAVGTQVTITGTGFGATRGSSTVTFNGTLTGTPTSWSATTIRVNVPAGATTGNVVVRASGVNSNGSPFTVLPTPTITSLSAPSGLIDETITITGTNFGATQGASTVRFNGTTASPASWSDTSIVTPIPAGATSGNIVVTVSGVNSAGASFIVFVTPAISGTSPTSSAVGGQVTINGSGFQANQAIGNSTVTFNGAVATPTSWTNTQIRALVPPDATSGPIVVTVADQPSNERSFTVRPTPTITSASPMYGAVGIIVTIDGTNFGNTQGSSTVKFNGTTATVTSWSATRIVVTVPSGATSGPLVVRTSNVDVSAGVFNVVTVTSLEVRPGNMTLPRDSRQRFQAIATNSDGSTQDIASSVTWASSTPAVGTIAADGVLTAVGAGQTSVQATFGSVSGSTSLTISGRGFTPIGASLIKPRSQHTATMLANGKVLIAAGSGRPAPNAPPEALRSAELYDPATRTVSSTGNLILRRQGHSATLLQNGKVLVVGGSTAHPSNPTFWTQTPTAELYDPATGAFSNTGSLHLGRSGHQAYLLPNGNVLIAGGYWDGYGLANTELYDPATGTFTESGNLAAPRGPGALLGDATVLFVGGVMNFQVLSSSERFDPATGVSTPDTDAPVLINSQSMIGLADGSVLVAGGGEGPNGTTTTSSWIYTPASQTFAATGRLAVARAHQPYAVLDNGPVLLVGGEWSSDGIITAELFDPVTRAYIGAGATSFPRSGHTATKLDDGTVLIAGGNLEDGVLELYGAGLPLPSTLQIAPASATLTMGGTQAFIATDELGRTRLDATWTVSDPSKAAVQATSAGATVTGLELGQATITADIEGVQAQAQVTIVPQSLRITPGAATLLIGQTRQFTVVDERGRPNTGVTWTSSDETLATITPDATTTMTAVAAGQVTLTAEVQGVTTSTEITISPDAAHAPGAIVWSVPTVDGFVPGGLVQATPHTSGVATFSVQHSTDNTESMVQAFTGDGRMMWQRIPRTLLGPPIASGIGGILITEKCDADNPVVLSNLDGVTGAIKWGLSISPQHVGTGCPSEAPKLAIRQDAAVAIAAPANTLPSFIVLSDAGALVADPTIPRSSATDMFNQTIMLPATMGVPIVDPDDHIYVQYAVRQVPFSGPMTSQLYLLKIAFDGTETTVQLDSATGANLFPGSIVPDGNGGVLATYTRVNSSFPAEPQPYRAAHVVGGTIVNTYVMPHAPTTITNGPNGLPIAPKLVLGGDGRVFAAYINNVAAFTLSSGASIWNYNAGQRIDVLAYTRSGGVALIDASSNHIELDDTGVLVASVALPGTFVQPTWTGEWQTAVLDSGQGLMRSGQASAMTSSSVSLATIAYPPLEWGDTVWSAQRGNPSSTGGAMTSDWFPALPAPERTAMDNALNDLIERLKYEPFRQLADIKVFTEMGNDRHGVPHTAEEFRKWLEAKRPSFYDGMKSTYCFASLVPPNIIPCSNNWKLSWANGDQVKATFAADSAAAAYANAATTNPPAAGIIFFRPSLIGLEPGGSNTGINVGNLGLLFHELLHNLYGRQDSEISLRLLGSVQVSCNINKYIQNEVLLGFPVPGRPNLVGTQIKMPCAQ